MLASLGVEQKIVLIVTSAGVVVGDVQPLVRLSVTCIAEESGKRQQGTAGGGGRVEFGFLHRGRPLSALGAAPPPTRRCATCSAVDAPAGTMTVVLGPGWPGVLLHEAVGHGLEGDFNRKKVVGVQRPHRPARRLAAVHRGRRRHASPTAAARSTSTTRARRPAAPC